MGKNFRGSKLLAVWPSGDASRSLFDAHNYRLFVPPLSHSEEAALQSASRVALVRAGDLFVFSGGASALLGKVGPGRPLCPPLCPLLYPACTDASAYAYAYACTCAFFSYLRQATPTWLSRCQKSSR